MNLHRTTGKPDWEAVAIKDRNIFQKIAAKTQGIATPANLISFIGFGLVAYGLILILQEQYWYGLIIVAFGRLLDVADGAVANATGTKSPLGEIVDAAIDKIGTLLTIFILIVANVTEWWVIALLLVPQIIISLVIIAKRQSGTKVHPTRVGKISMALVWAAITAIVVGKALGDPAGFDIFTSVVVLASALLAFYALWQYSTGRDA